MLLLDSKQTNKLFKTPTLPFPLDYPSGTWRKLGNTFWLKKQLVFNVTIRVFLSFILVYIALFNFWEEIVVSLYGSQFIDVTTIINFLGIGSIIYFSSQLLLEYLKGIGKEIYASVPHFISIIMHLILLYFFSGDINILSITYIYSASFIISSLVLLTIFFRVKDDRN